MRGTVQDSVSYRYYRQLSIIVGSSAAVAFLVKVYGNIFVGANVRLLSLADVTESCTVPQCFSAQLDN